MSGTLIRYEGDFVTESEDAETGIKVRSDVPKEFGGKARGIGPTDMLSISLGSCIATMMAFAARKLKVDIGAFTIEVNKEMAKPPLNRIAKFTIHIRVPVQPESAAIQRLEEVARHCPVHNSLHPDVEQEMIFEWGV